MFFDDEGNSRTELNDEEKQKQAEGNAILEMNLIALLSISPKLTLKTINKDPKFGMFLLSKLAPILKEANSNFL
jgi:hypothetical protein